MKGKALPDDRKAGEFSPLSDAQIHRSTYTAILLALLLPPAMGSTLAALIGFYPFPEIYLIFTSYTGVYVVAVVAFVLWLTPHATRFVTNLVTLDKETAQARTKRVFTRLPWMLFGFITLYTIGGAFSADIALEDMGYRNYTLRDHLYNQLSVIPVVLITSLPIFFYYVDRLGRYLGPRGITVTAIPLWVKLIMLGLVVPVLIDSVLIGYYLNHTGYFEWQTAVLWGSLLVVAAAGTWLAWRSLRQGLDPIRAFIESSQANLVKQATKDLAPKSLDELGALTQSLADLLARQKQLAGDLAQTRQLADSIIDGAGALVVVMNREGRIVRFNRACEELSGLSFEEVEGKFPWETFLPPDEAEITRKKAFDTLVAEPRKGVGKYTNFWLGKNRKRYLTEWTNSVLLDEDGNMEFMVAIGAEVTKREEFAKALKEKAMVIDQIHDSVVSTDLDGLVTGWNKGAERIFGHTAEEMIGRPISMLYPPDQQTVLRDSVIGPLKEKGTHETEVIMLRKNGERFHGHLSLSLLRDGNSNAIGMIGYTMDITEQRKAIQAVIESDTRMNEAQRLAKVGSWELDLVNNRLVWSDEIFRMFEVDKEKFGASYEAFLNAIHPEDRDMVNKAYSDSLVSREPYEIVHRLRMADGRIKHVRENCKTDFGDDGKPLRSMGTVQDISELHKAEMELLEHRERLEELVRKRTEQLGESEKLLRQAQKIARIGHWQANLKTGGLHWSDEIFSIFGRKRADFSPSIANFYSCVHPDDVTLVRETEKHSFEGVGHHSVDHRIVLPDGEIRWVHEQAQLTRDEHGEPWILTGTVQDITERKQAELNLALQSRRTELILESAQDGFFAADHTGRVRTVNSAFCEMLGYSKDELLQMSIPDFEANESQEDVAAHIAKIIETGHDRFDSRHRRKDGKLVDIEISVNLVLVGGERMFYAFVRDISSRLQSANVIRQTAERLNNAQLIARMGDYSFDVANGELVWSDTTHDLLGYQTGEVTPSLELWFARVHPDDLSYIQQQMDYALSGPHQPGQDGNSRLPDLDYRILLPEGRIRWMHSEAFVTLDGAGRVTRLTGTIQDFTERKQAEEAIIAAKNEAERANKAKSEFLSRMSHELRTPLNAILGFGQLLEEDKSLLPMQSEGVHEIVHAGKHLLELINEILDLSRIEAGHIDLSLEPVEMMPVVNECMTMVKPLADQRQIVIEAETNSCGHQLVLADRVRLRQILINLLSNAVKYNHDAGSVFIDCNKNSDGSIRLSVRDSGLGIKPESINRLFRPFERLESPYSGIEGSGIGLALVKRLAEAMGGKIGVESEAGVGSTFWVDFPEANHEKKHEERDVSEAETVNPHVGTILYIEDNPANIRLMQSIIELSGNLKLLDAMTAEKGIAMAKANPPGLILMDINLPGMDGYEALRHLRADPITRGIPVVAITANAMKSERERGLAEGFDDYLTKPLDVAYLSRRISEFLMK